MANRGTRKRWLVDGMNVIGTRPDRWWNDPDGAVRRMTRFLDDFAAATGDNVMVVYDKRTSGLEPEHVEVEFAKWKGRNAADHEIEEIVSSDEDPSSLLVVTSDKRLAERVGALGARVVPSGRFRKQLDSVVKNREDD
jgi:predicted RNA-binding protein with PIN domain